MSRFWSPVVHTLTPYVPGEQPKLPGLVKLNTNENPYGPSPGVIKALTAEATDVLRLYPDPNAGRLKQAISVYHGVTPAQVFVGNGSDEVLAHAFQALLRHDAPVLFPDVTYSFYPAYCRLYDIKHQVVPLTEALEVRVEDFGCDCGGVVLPNPNAPTGSALPRAGIEALLDRHPGQVVVVDEAYVDFGAESAVPLVQRYPNLLVVQTLSKSRSLAGLRVGFAIGHPTLIEALGRVKDSFNSYPLGRLAIAGAVAAFGDDEHFQGTRRRIMDSRDRLSGRLSRPWLHRPVLGGELCLRFPSLLGRGAAGSQSARTVHLGPPFPGTGAYRRIHAHQHRHRAGVQSVDAGVGRNPWL